MKFICIFFIIILTSCVGSKKIYVCGDRACIDKKEFKEYFAKNLVLEVKIKNPKRKTSIDLAKLNTGSSNNTKTSKPIFKTKKLNNKQKKTLLKLEKAKLKKERKIKKNNDKIKIKEERKLKKVMKTKKTIDNNSVYDKSIKETVSTNTKKLPTKKNNPVNKKVVNKNELLKSPKLQNQVSICEDLKDCDIEKISKLLIEKGRKKDFPDLASK